MKGGAPAGEAGMCPVWPSNLRVLHVFASCDRSNSPVSQETDHNASGFPFFLSVFVRLFTCCHQVKPDKPEPERALKSKDHGPRYLRSSEPSIVHQYRTSVSLPSPFLVFNPFRLAFDIISSSSRAHTFQKRVSQLVFV